MPGAELLGKVRLSQKVAAPFWGGLGNPRGFSRASTVFTRSPRRRSPRERHPLPHQLLTALLAVCPPDELAPLLDGAPELEGLEIRSSTAALTVLSPRGVLWGGRAPAPDCAAAAEMVRLEIARRRDRPPAVWSGPLPDLRVLRAPWPPPPPPPSPPEPWTAELAVSGTWAASTGRFGAAIEGALRREGFGGRLQLGAFLPRAEDVAALGTTEHLSAHALLLAEGCLSFAPELRGCAAAGGGVEWLRASASGPLLFRTETRERMAPRIDGVVSFGLAPRPFGLEVVLRGAIRPSPTRLRVEGVGDLEALPALVLGLDLRASLDVF